MVHKLLLQLLIVNYTLLYLKFQWQILNHDNGDLILFIFTGLPWNGHCYILVGFFFQETSQRWSTCRAKSRRACSICCCLWVPWPSANKVGAPTIRSCPRLHFAHQCNILHPKANIALSWPNAWTYWCECLQLVWRLASGLQSCTPWPAFASRYKTGKCCAREQNVLLLDTEAVVHNFCLLDAIPFSTVTNFHLCKGKDTSVSILIVCFTKKSKGTVAIDQVSSRAFNSPFMRVQLTQST